MIILFYIIGLLISFILIGYVQYLVQKSKINYLKNNNLLLNIDLIHISGHPYLRKNWKYKTQITKNNKINFIEYITNKTFSINFSQLNKYEINTEEQLQKSVTIPRLLVLGIASLLVPKTTKNNNQYLYLQYTDSGVNVDCLFKNVNNEPIGDIISTINKSKIEQNKKEGVME